MKLLATAASILADLIVQPALHWLQPNPPQPWQCHHKWRIQPATSASTPSRSCTYCGAAELLWDTQPPLHPESMAVLLPPHVEKHLSQVDDELWPEEAA